MGRRIETEHPPIRKSNFFGEAEFFLRNKSGIRSAMIIAHPQLERSNLSKKIILDLMTESINTNRVIYVRTAEKHVEIKVIINPVWRPVLGTKSVFAYVVEILDRNNTNIDLREGEPMIFSSRCILGLTNDYVDYENYIGDGIKYIA